MTKEFTWDDLNKTLWVKPAWLEKNRKRVEFDANGIILWKLAEKIANFLIWKWKVEYCDFWDAWDFVVIKNVEKIKVTWNKLLQKMYFRYSGRKGNVKSTNLKDMLVKHPERVLRFAVRGMLPKNKLRAKRLKRLKLFVWENSKYNYMKPQKLAA